MGLLERKIVRGMEEGFEVVCRDEVGPLGESFIFFEADTADNDVARLAEIVASQHVLRTGHAITLIEYLHEPRI